jgi:ribose transport system ATP-binding protein
LLTIDRLSRGDRVRDVSLTVRRGEIVGISGLVGSGRTELLRAIYGADPPDSGAIFLEGSNRPRVFRHPGQAVRAGIGMVPEDRKSQGLMLPLSIRANLTLASIAQLFGRAGWITRSREHEPALAACGQVELRRTSLDEPVGQLSGGTQQKVVMGRWLIRAPKVLLLDEPTRGIDITSKFAIYRLIEELARMGKGILVVSSEVEELMLLCDRIAVLSAGRVVRVFDRGEWSQERLLAAAFQGYSTAPVPPGASRS